MKRPNLDDVSVADWIKGIVGVILVTGLSIWMGSWWVLILVPIVFDIYVSKMVHWLFWRPRDEEKMSVLASIVDLVIFVLFWIYIAFLFIFQNYMIPSSSLEKTLLVGDMLCVSKLSYGPRMPNTPIYLPIVQNTLPLTHSKSYLDWPLLDYKRLSGLGDVERDDIVVFNFPAGDTVCLGMVNPDYYYILMTEGTNQAIQNKEDYTNREFKTSWERNHYLSELGRRRVWSIQEELGGITWRPVDKRDCYVKRCIGLPGDTIEIRHNIVYVNGQKHEDAPMTQYNYDIKTNGVILNDKFYEQLDISNDDKIKGSIGSRYILPLTKEKADEVAQMSFIESIVMEEEEKDSTGLRVFPYSKDYPWSRDNYGPLCIPSKGTTVEINEVNALLYERIITSYEGHKLDVKDKRVYIDNQETDRYTFQMDYYWMMGDNRHNSADSRYWGFVPEDHIIGKPLFVLLSFDKDKGGMRWNRLFKKVE